MSSLPLSRRRGCKAPDNGIADAQALQLQSIVSHRWLIHPCSAYTGTGLNEGLDWVVTEVAGRLYWNGLPSTPSTQTLPTQALSAST
jgi:hypothetical protein